MQARSGACASRFLCLCTVQRWTGTPSQTAAITLSSPDVPSTMRNSGRCSPRRMRSSRTVRQSLSRLIAARSLHPQTYISARDFLQSLSGAPPDCLLLDQQMPDMTGLELQHKLSSAGFNIPTIVITAHDRPDLQQQHELAGAVAYLLKPLDQSTLIAAVTWAIAMGSASDQARIWGRQDDP
jgi:CheY-like chemotaxis protein